MLTSSMEGILRGLSRCRRSRDTVVRYMEMLSMVSNVAMKMASARKAVMSAGDKKAGHGLVLKYWLQIG